MEEDLYITRVLLVDDDPEFSSGLTWVIQNTQGFESVGTYSTCAEAVMNLDNSVPDVILMDIGLPDASGIDCTRKIKRVFPSVQILMVTVHAEEDKIFESLRAGAVGYILKKTPPAEILNAVREAQRGGAPMSGEVARKVLNYFNQGSRQEITSGLSDREKDVLNELIQGHSYKAIADKLFVSPHTVRFHLHNIYVKLHVNTRAEAVAEALKRKIPGGFP